MVKKICTVILVIGVLVAGYGAYAFFVDTSLPPNNDAMGRLPALYIMLGGIGGMLVGVLGRDFKLK